MTVKDSTMSEWTETLEHHECGKIFQNAVRINTGMRKLCLWKDTPEQRQNGHKHQTSGPCVCGKIDQHRVNLDKAN